MRKSISKVKVESCFIRVGFFSSKKRELKCVGCAAVEVPSFDDEKISPELFDSFVTELCRYHVRRLNKSCRFPLFYQSYEILLSVEEAHDEGLVEYYMPESFLRKHRLFVVG